MFEEMDDELMAIFYDDARKDRITLEEGLSKQDWEQVRIAAHRIKGTAASFGFPQLSETGKALQQLIDDQQLDEANDLAGNLLEQLNTTLPDD